MKDIPKLPEEVESTDAEEYATAGKLYQMFHCPTARILDQVEIVGNMPQTVSMLAESTNLPPGIVRSVILLRLIERGVMKEAGKIGREQAYSFIANVKVIVELLEG